MTIRVACIGAGPGGLFFSSLLKQYLPDSQVTVFERNRPTDAFGFGVVFSDATLRRINEADPVLRDGLQEFGCHWDTIEMRVKKAVHTFAGNGMSAIHRKTLLRLLQDRARETGVELRFGTPATAADLDDYDLVVGSDGAHSGTRTALGGLGHTEHVATTKYIWFGTTYRFDGLTNIHLRNEHGNFAAVGYPIGPDIGTFVVECDEDTWRRAGLDTFDTTQPPGDSDLLSQRYLEELFREEIDGHPLVGNNSRWANFRTRSTERWSSGSTVLLGDAVHTAHFSVGSGTKMAMEDAVVLAQQVARSTGDLPGALAAYEAERKPQVLKIQSAARPSLSWWERFELYYESFDPLRFTFHYFTRHLDIEKLRRRDPALAGAVEADWEREHGAPALATPLHARPAAFTGRDLALVDDAGSLYLTDGERGARLPVDRAPRPDGSAAVLVSAPRSEEEVATVAAGLPAAGTVVIAGGTALTRSLITDEARLRRGLTAVVVEECDQARAATLVLSGRADAVVRSAPHREEALA
ncbi:FAD-dependent monooxygenase [Streptomyces tendae]